MASRNKFLVLILLSVLLGVSLWVFDKSRKGEGPFDSDPIVVDVSQTGINDTGTEGNPNGSIDGAMGSETSATATGNPVFGAGGAGTEVAGNIGTEEGASPFVPEGPNEIEAFDAYVTDAGIVLEWISGDESSDQHDTLGYRVYRVASNGTETLVADMTTAATGAGDLYNLTESGQDGGHFVIDRVNRDLSVSRPPRGWSPRRRMACM